MESGTISEGQKALETLKNKLMEITAYSRKVNENIRAVNVTGGSIIHEGYRRSMMKGMIEGLLNDRSAWSLDFPQSSQIKRWLQEISEQDLNRSYDPDLVDDNIRKIEASF